MGDKKSKRTIEFLLKLWFGNIWISRTVALLALLNLLMVIFDLSYVPLRDFWLLGHSRIFAVRLGWLKSEGINLKVLPDSVTNLVTKYYDPIKGIEPHSQTQSYLNLVSQVESNINNLNSPQVAQLLTKLQEDSQEIIETNPFQIANKTGSLERIKNLMRTYIHNPKNSATQSLKTFWSAEYLQSNTNSKLAFFNNKIKPLIYSNYYRHLDENGKYVDYLYLLDFPFTVFFFFDYLGRTLYLAKINPGFRWRDTLLWRWYDVFLFISFWRILRVIPVVMRLKQTGLLKTRGVEKQINRGVVSIIAKEMTEAVVIRILNNIEISIDSGDFLTVITPKNQYLNSQNKKDELKAILGILLQFVSQKVVPDIRVDLQKLIEYSIKKSLNEQSSLKYVPYFLEIQKELIGKTIDSIFNISDKMLVKMLEDDPVFDQYFEQFKTRLFMSIASLKYYEKLPELTHLSKEFIEEVKLQYIDRLQQEIERENNHRKNDIVSKKKSKINEYG